MISDSSLMQMMKELVEIQKEVDEIKMCMKKIDMHYCRVLISLHAEAKERGMLYDK
mgnify:CR=1 FL=1